MEEKNEAEEILKILVEEREVMSNFRDEMNKDFKEMSINTVRQKREFYKHLTLLSGIILGLSSFINPELLSSLYYQIGLSLHLLVIVYLVLYLREVIDKEGLELQTLQDKYNEIASSKILLIDEYLNKDVYSIKNYKGYLSRLRNLPTIQDLNKDVEKLDEDRKNRNKQVLDYSGELVSFFFITGTLFITLSVAQYAPSFLLLSSVILLVFYLSFVDINSIFIVKPLNVILVFLKKDIRNSTLDSLK